MFSIYRILPELNYFEINSLGITQVVEKFYGI